MAKSRKTKKPAEPPGAAPLARTSSAHVADPNIGYKLRVLLQYFRNIAKDHTAQNRMSMTTDPLYISAPYFTADEAASLKGAIVDTWMPPAHDDPDIYEVLDFEGSLEQEPMTVQEMIERCMARFLEKRRASGDFRPCGPHDMAPVYDAVFGLDGADLRAEGFLRRLRKSGLPPVTREED